MNRKELEERVDEILLKRTRGEQLTRQEEKILAYTYHAAGQRKKSIWLRSAPALGPNIYPTVVEP